MEKRIQTILLLLLCAMLPTACGTVRTTQTSRSEATAMQTEHTLHTDATSAHRDSLRASTNSSQEEQRSLVHQTTEMVREATARVAVPLTALRELPDGAVYMSRSGHATVTLTRDGDTLRATGHCDSVARRCIRYEQTVFRQQHRADSLHRELANERRTGDERLTQRSTLLDRTEQRNEQRPAHRGRWFWTGLLIGLAAGLYLRNNPLFTRFFN